MSLTLARVAIDWYLSQLRQADVRNAEIHFFGGEPFCAEDVITFAVEYARARASADGLSLRFEVATNGTMDLAHCRWAATQLDSVVLSLDGPAEIHDQHRPSRGEQSSFEIVARNAKVFAEGSTDLCLRSCITSASVNRMEEIATWFAETYQPQSVCFETLQPTPQSQAASLEPPDPWLFAHNFIRAARILETFGIEPVYAASDVRVKRISFCPVGDDVAIVLPNGDVAACYLMPRDWQAQGLDLQFGKIAGGDVVLDAGAVEQIRNLNMLNRFACAHCFCRWHCAGGCQVNHRLGDSAGDYDRLCLQTRIITLRNILATMRQDSLMSDLLQNQSALEMAVRQRSDVLDDFGN